MKVGLKVSLAACAEERGFEMSENMKFIIGCAVLLVGQFIVAEILIRALM